MVAAKTVTQRSKTESRTRAKGQARKRVKSVALSGQVLLRAGLRNPVATHAALTRIGDLVPALLAGAGLRGTSVNPVGAGLWVVHRGGHAVGSYGVTAGQLVAGNVPPAALAVLARRPTEADPDGGGALSARVPRSIVASLAGDLGGIPDELRGLVLGRLGDLHGWLSASTLGIRMSFRQDVK